MARHEVLFCDLKYVPQEYVDLFEGSSLRDRGTTLLRNCRRKLAAADLHLTVDERNAIDIFLFLYYQQIIGAVDGSLFELGGKALSIPTKTFRDRLAKVGALLNHVSARHFRLYSVPRSYHSARVAA